MSIFKILSSQNNTILYQGDFASFRQCLEHAVRDHVNLARARLRNMNLSNANLDDAQLCGADFTHSNLSGANLSESHLRGAKFTGTALYNCCLAYSDLRESNFENALFGATDITGSNLSACRFSTLSCFSLDFTHAQVMNDCAFINPDGIISTMSQPPIVIRGLSYNPVILMDNHVKNGHEIGDYPQWLALLKQELSRDRKQKAS